MVRRSVIHILRQVEFAFDAFLLAQELVDVGGRDVFIAVLLEKIQELLLGDDVALAWVAVLLGFYLILYYIM